MIIPVLLSTLSSPAFSGAGPLGGRGCCFLWFQAQAIGLSSVNVLCLSRIW